VIPLNRALKKASVAVVTAAGAYLLRPPLHERPSTTFRLSLLAALTLCAGACTSPSQSVESLRLNAFQVIGSHNSYKLRPDPEVYAELGRVDPWRAVNSAYHNETLTQQLDLGLRHLEIDVVADPDGGLFAEPALGAAQDQEALRRPGFKVLHLPDYDYKTSCIDLEACLQEVLAWSSANPGHFPIFIHMNARQSSGRRWPDLQTISELVDSAQLQALNERLLALVPPSRRVTASEIELAGDWPKLAEARGKVLFFLDGSAAQARQYRTAVASSVARILVTDAHEDANPVDRYTVVLDPREQPGLIGKCVRAGFMVRTLGEYNTIEARRGEWSRLRAAMDSGAQIISIESYFDDPALRSRYVVFGFYDTVNRYRSYKWVRHSSYDKLKIRGNCRTQTDR
jgi:hypothetical protein